MRSVDDVVDFLRSVVRDADHGVNPLAYGIFGRAYLRMTLEVIAQIASGCFEDPGWVRSFVVSFAEAYAHAMRAGSGAASPWRLAFGEAASDRRRVLRHLVLGINAHMAYDLAVVVRDVAGAEAERRRRDYFALDPLLDWTIEPIATIVAQRYSPWLGRLDRAAVGTNGLAVSAWFRFNRDGAWRDGLALHAGHMTLRELDRKIHRRGLLFRTAVRV